MTENTCPQNGLGELRIFCVHAKKDKRHLAELKKRLMFLKKMFEEKENLTLRIWDRTKTIAGQHKETVQAKELEQAHIILVLLTSDCLVECDKLIDHSLARNREGSADLIPIMVRDVDLAGHAISKLEPLPGDDKPVTNWKPQIEGWNQVSKGIQEAIQKSRFTALRLAAEAKKHLADSTLKIRPYPQSASSNKPTLIHSIRHLWRMRTDGVLQEGKLVEIKGVVSQYVPLIIGSPITKRKVHLAYRQRLSKISDLEEEPIRKAQRNALLAFTAGQLVWRLHRVESAQWHPLGFYQAIVRNSVPLFVAQDYYLENYSDIFRDGLITIEAQVVANVHTIPGRFLDDIVRKQCLQDFMDPEYFTSEDTSLGFFVTGEGTSIKFRNEAQYLDGDVWIDTRCGAHEYFRSRFLDLSDKEDVLNAITDLRVEVAKDDAEVLLEFDQVDRPFDAPTLEEVEGRIEQLIESWSKDFEKQKELG